MAKNGLKLDTVKLRNLLNAYEKTDSWLANQIGKGRQWVHYDLKTGCTSRIHLYAAVFRIDAKDLIK